ncbi:hypothetical protein [Actinomyces denticolens]|uniref:hypothetical protein n=1 Tax=Actinomyces denticolens TaxID=52767 RepID=UPI0027D925DA|nr:hypothetical protein [Actinomyces denticolens]
MVQRLLDSDPALAHEHARYAASHAGRIAVVREAAGIAAYLSEHYTDALRDIRAARRLSGLDLHRAIEADCERALGRYNQALKAAAEADPKQLDDVERPRSPWSCPASATRWVRTSSGSSSSRTPSASSAGPRDTATPPFVRADRLEDLGRGQEAEAIRERIGKASAPQKRTSRYTTSRRNPRRSGPPRTLRWSLPRRTAGTRSPPGLPSTTRKAPRSPVPASGSAPTAPRSFGPSRRRRHRGRAHRAPPVPRHPPDAGTGAPNDPDDIHGEEDKA